MDEIGGLIVCVVLPCVIAFSVGEAIGAGVERKEIKVQCERIGTVIINDKVYECRLKEGVE